MGKKQETGKWWLQWVTFAEYAVKGRWHLYRCYGREGALLYVGMTSDLRRRFSVHKALSPWYRLMVRVDIVEFLDKASARRAESRVIWLEKPFYNTHGNGGLRVEKLIDMPTDPDGVG